MEWQAQLFENDVYLKEPPVGLHIGRMWQTPVEVATYRTLFLDIVPYSHRTVLNRQRTVLSSYRTLTFTVPYSTVPYSDIRVRWSTVRFGILYIYYLRYDNNVVQCDYVVHSFMCFSMYDRIWYDPVYHIRIPEYDEIRYAPEPYYDTRVWSNTVRSVYHVLIQEYDEVLQSSIPYSDTIDTASPEIILYDETWTPFRSDGDRRTPKLWLNSYVKHMYQYTRYCVTSIHSEYPLSTKVACFQCKNNLSHRSVKIYNSNPTEYVRYVLF